MKLNGYNVYYNNVTGRVVYNRNNNIPVPNIRVIPKKDDKEDFDKKIE